MAPGRACRHSTQLRSVRRRTKKRARPVSFGAAQRRTDSASARSRPLPALCLAAFRVTAIQARHAAIEHHRSRGVALAAQLRALRKAVVRERVLLARALLELRALARDHLA